MTHPSNKLERKKIKIKKGKRRKELHCDDREIPGLVNIYGDHAALCSCSMCGNPRRFFDGKEKLTIQERKHNDATQDQIETGE